MALIASRSILATCKHRINNPVTADTRIPTTFPTGPGDTVYVHVAAIPNFVERYLPYVKFPIVLVSGDSDATVPDDLPRFIVNHILGHPMIRVWYSQNCTRPSDKLRQLPIGLYFHVIFQPPSWVAITESTEAYESCINTLSKNTARQARCFCNFQFLTSTRYGQDRIDALSKIPKHLLYIQPNRISSMDTWRLMSTFKYVVSPHGNGLDCHRTWEALALGCTPIVKTSALDPLFKGLPVLIVKDWSDINSVLLDTFIPETYAMEKLSIQYWLSEFSRDE